MPTLYEFVRESNMIEGIVHAPTDEAIDAHKEFLTRDRIDVVAIARFVWRIAEAPIRVDRGMNVMVGGHVPPPGGPHIQEQLDWLCSRVNDGVDSPWRTHVEYEALHPFMDGNGRSGRVLWAWQMRRDGHDPFALRFLHRWYYQSLDAGRR